jgi:hypothetical protein
MMVCWGAVIVPRTDKVNPDRDHPVLTIAPSVKVPLLATVRSLPELELRVPDVCPVVIAKLRPLISCAMVRGFTSRFVRVMVIVLRLVTNVARASTGLPPLSVAPGAVSKVNVDVGKTVKSGDVLALAVRANKHVSMDNIFRVDLNTRSRFLWV